MNIKMEVGLSGECMKITFMCITAKCMVAGPHVHVCHPTGHAKK